MGTSQLLRPSYTIFLTSGPLSVTTCKPWSCPYCGVGQRVAHLTSIVMVNEISLIATPGMNKSAVRVR
ncbi:Uncharacterized protein HZ326_10998 [Fusarium oxysporum f. sp. albedinis]|nr:Uncharacterized protein HZ326_10998 [Fusarium oxysporum f. sp. albedinis]